METTRQSRLLFAGLEDLESDFSRVLTELGMHRALGFLNLRTWHRFTGVYQFRGRALRCHALFDRENLQVRDARDEEISTTYCAIVGRFSTAFMIEDSLTDERLVHHPAREQVRAFHGVPLLDSAERCVGALVHWDTRPQTLRPSEARLMFAATPLLAKVMLEERRSQELMFRSLRHRATRRVAV